MTGISTMLSLPSGKPPRGAATSYEISERTGVDSSVIRRWLRRYRLYGHHSLQPFWRPARRKDCRAERHADRDQLYREAYDAYVTFREPVASITRRFNLDYHSFKYHVERYHPELVAARARLLRPEPIYPNKK